MGNLSSLLSNAGFTVNVAEADIAFDTVEAVKPPFTTKYLGSGLTTFNLLKDAEFIRKTAKPLDIKMLKRECKPVEYDEIFAWVLKNHEHCKVVNPGGVHRTNPHKIKGRYSTQYDYESDTRYGLTCLSFVIQWDETYQKFYIENMAGNATDFLDRMKEECIFIPIDLRSLAARGYIPTSNHTRVSVLGQRILLANHLKDAVKESESAGFKIKPKYFYFVFENGDKYSLRLDKSKIRR